MGRQIILDLFAGAGGWDEAAVGLGHTIHRVETDPAANATARAAGHPTLGIRNAWVPITRHYHGIVASPPCQPFTVANGTRKAETLAAVDHGLRTGAADTFGTLIRYSRTLPDPRAGLVLAPLAHVLTITPTWVAFEQVTEVLDLWHLIATTLTDHGYHTWVGKLHAETYGVPQTRTRAFLLAHQHHQPTRPAATHSRYYPRNPTRTDPGLPPPVTLAQALGWDETQVGTVYSNYGVGGHPEKGTRPTDAPAFTVTSKTNRQHIGWAHHRPATTIVGTWRPDLVTPPDHRTRYSRQHAPDAVQVTVAEAGVLQGFRPDYPWRGQKNPRHQQIGNAVPPPVAKAVIGHLTTLE